MSHWSLKLSTKENDGLVPLEDIDWKLNIFPEAKL